MSMSLPYYPIIQGPVALYNNVAVNPQYFKPRAFAISAIALGVTTTITTVLDMDYVIGQEVRLLIPPGDGCRLLNQTTSFVIALPSANQVTLNINSIGNDSFNSTNTMQSAQIVAVGDVNTGAVNEEGRRNNITYVPGAFRNISPD
jgi:hypothetical protein